MNYVRLAVGLVMAFFSLNGFALSLAPACQGKTTDVEYRICQLERKLSLLEGRSAKDSAELCTARYQAANPRWRRDACAAGMAVGLASSSVCLPGGSQGQVVMFQAYSDSQGGYHYQAYKEGGGIIGGASMVKFSCQNKAWVVTK